MRKLKNSELGRLSNSEFKQSKKTPLIVVLDHIRSLNNIGAVFRTSDAFLIEKIYLCGITAKPPHKDIHKTALGATDSVAWEYVEDIHQLIDNLKAQGVVVVAIEQADKAIALNDFKPTDSTHAVIFGNEVKGVQQSVVDTADHCLEIPQFGTKHSLNIAVSCGVVLWELFNKLKH